MIDNINPRVNHRIALYALKNRSIYDDDHPGTLWAPALYYYHHEPHCQFAAKN
jgi:hypothetical protein